MEIVTKDIIVPLAIGCKVTVDDKVYSVVSVCQRIANTTSGTEHQFILKEVMR